VWHTDRGLNVGEPLARTRTLYPQARRHADGWWLVVRKNDHLFGTYGQLVAGIRGGTISYLRLVLHEEGD
jgi:hypothetical protein